MRTSASAIIKSALIINNYSPHIQSCHKPNKKAENSENSGYHLFRTFLCQFNDQLSVKLPEMLPSPRDRTPQKSRQFLGGWGWEGGVKEQSALNKGARCSVNRSPSQERGIPLFKGHIWSPYII